MPKTPELRKNRRYPSIAHARIHEAFTGDALLKDLSITGCCVECTMQPNMELQSRYKIKIIPEHDSKIGSFDLMVECKWIRAADYACDIGFSVVGDPKGRTFQRYVDYLSWRST